jgi:hypothetical protein
VTTLNWCPRLYMIGSLISSSGNDKSILLFTVSLL